MKKQLSKVAIALVVILSPLLMLALSPSANASIAYGSLNNFDAVNDTGVPCHGFEIEIDDIHSKDITYTYDWNHYGVPKITEDNSDPLHPKVFVRYESAKNPDGTWAAYTAVPSGPIAPTDGHQFTDPTVNFGGEHFGVGFYGTPSAVKYNWLIDDGAGRLIYGGAVNISTPTFTYYPPAPAMPAQVQAVIVPPPPPEQPVLEFGEASWVKVTSTTTHNNQKVELRDLVSDDPNDPNDRNWQNGEPDEVEVEWQLMQTEFNAAGGGANGEIVGAPEELPNGDEIVTRRYDFFKYVGPLDTETGEALAESVGPDGIHGVGDFADVIVVGDYIGAQMAGFDPAGQIGLIDHLQDGEINVPYVDRTIVIGGTAPIVTTRTGALPDGMNFDEVTGLLSGTPTVSGTFTFNVHSTDASGGDVTTTYHLTIVDAGVVQPVHITVATIASPVAGGNTSGGGEYVIGTDVTVGATANHGFVFASWTDGGTVVSTSPGYQFTANVNRELVAYFVPNQPPVANSDSASTDEDGVLTISPATLLGNDTDADSDTLAITSVQDASCGTVALVGGDVVFTSPLNFNGPASFRYTISDGNGGTSTATVSITVTPVNDAPVASAGIDQTVRPHDTVTLDGSGCTDADGDALTYSWSLTEMPANSKAALSGSASRYPTFTADKAGTYVLSLVVNDGTVDSTPVTVTINATKGKK